MADYLIGLAVGPVQGFIAAARRTRDLWFGSQILSEISKAAALQLANDGCELIFPAPLGKEDLQPRLELNVGNKLMVKAATDDPLRIVNAAKRAAKAHWEEQAEEARSKLKEGAVRADIWKAQLNDVVELYAAWVKIDQGYSAARQRLEQLMGARKSTRDFAQTATGFQQSPAFGLPKSSLDAARETVLTEDLVKQPRFKTDRRKLGLGNGEHLDCPGLVKRLGDEPDQFPPITRIALEAWLKNIPAQDLARVNEAYHQLVGIDLATRVKANWLNKLPYDGQMLYPSRIEAGRRDLDKDEDAEAIQTLDGLKSAVSTLHRRYGEPTPYFAVLVADGDKMGAFIDNHDSESAHVKITQALAGFAARARGIVQEHQGASVYTGGDDVLALLPVHTAVACSRRLYEDFAATMQGMGIADTLLPTLSVGLGLGHVLTPFSRLLDLGRRAEKLAKEGQEGTKKENKRDALALIVGVRSGAEIAVRGRWQDGLDQRLRQWMDFYLQDRLSDKTPYDLRLALGQLEWAKDRSDYKMIGSKEAERVLKKKRAESGSKELEAKDIQSITDAIEQVGLETIVSELLVARWLSAKAKE